MSKMGIIFSPVVSEKSFRLAAARQYTFRVDPRATGPAIADAIASLYGVKVTAIRTSNRLGKVTRYKGRSGSRSSEKRAIVTLKTGDRIAGFEVETPAAAETKAEKVVKTAKSNTATETSKKSGVTPLRSEDGASAGQATTVSKAGVTTTVRTGKKESK